MRATHVVHPWNRRVAAITTVTVFIAMSVIVGFAITSTSLGPSTSVTLPTLTGNQPAQYPVGTPDKAEISGMGLPSPNAMPGYTMTYSTTFSGDSVPAGWIVYHGQPLDDPGAQFGTAHVVVRGGMLRLNAWRDPRYKNRWVTGGVCHCAMPRTYSAYFVRSRVTGGGASEVQLLWPQANTWPPEVDFNETGGRINSTSSTVHFGPTNQIDQRELRINMVRWHTWGVIWTPKSIKYVVDGVVWASVTTASEIPNIAMTLRLQQQTWCFQGRLCPTAPVSMLVKWVAEYQAT